VDRLSTSPAARDLVLKGGVLLAAYDVRRPTRDVDLSAKQTANDPESVRRLITRAGAILPTSTCSPKSTQSVPATSAKSIRQVAMFRAATLSPLSLALPGYGQLAQTKWAAWVRKQHLEDRLSLVFEIVLAAVQKFADPLMLADDAIGVWDPAMHAWKSRR
jgi:hypothetical protein